MQFKHLRRFSIDNNFLNTYMAILVEKNAIYGRSWLAFGARCSTFPLSPIHMGHSSSGKNSWSVSGIPKCGGVRSVGHSHGVFMAMGNHTYTDQTRDGSRPDGFNNRLSEDGVFVCMGYSTKSASTLSDRNVCNIIGNTPNKWCSPIRNITDAGLAAAIIRHRCP